MAYNISAYKHQQETQRTVKRIVDEQIFFSFKCREDDIPEWVQSFPPKQKDLPGQRFMSVTRVDLFSAFDQGLKNTERAIVWASRSANLGNGNVRITIATRLRTDGQPELSPREIADLQVFFENGYWNVDGYANVDGTIVLDCQCPQVVKPKVSPPDYDLFLDQNQILVQPYRS